MYFLHSGLQDESLQVTISKLPMVLYPAQGVTFPAQGTSSKRPDPKDGALIYCHPYK